MWTNISNNDGAKERFEENTKRVGGNSQSISTDWGNISLTVLFDRGATAKLQSPFILPRVFRC